LLGVPGAFVAAGLRKRFLAPITASTVLTELHIANFAVIEDLSLEFSHGFHVLTGETGAGKSILVDAI
jgi:predicted ATPase